MADVSGLAAGRHAIGRRRPGGSRRSRRCATGTHRRSRRLLLRQGVRHYLPGHAAQQRPRWPGSGLADARRDRLAGEPVRRPWRCAWSRAAAHLARDWLAGRRLRAGHARDGCRWTTLSRGRVRTGRHPRAGRRTRSRCSAGRAHPGRPWRGSPCSAMGLRHPARTGHAVHLDRVSQAHPAHLPGVGPAISRHRARIQPGALLRIERALRGRRHARLRTLSVCTGQR